MLCVGYCVLYKLIVWWLVAAGVDLSVVVYSVSVEWLSVCLFECLYVVVRVYMYLCVYLVACVSLCVRMCVLLCVCVFVVCWLCVLFGRLVGWWFVLLIG